MSKDLASELIDLLGGTSAVAARFEIRPPSVSEWRDKGIPQDKLMRLAPEAERASRGRLVCETVCPDVQWRRIKDKAWPWHPAGKPLIDVLPADQVQAEPSEA